MDKYTVLGVDGSVDVAASVASYSQALSSWVSQNEVPVERIESAVEAVFDTHPSRILLDTLVSYAAHNFGANPDNFTSVCNRIRSYVRSQCANNTGRIDIVGGKGGGVSRLARPGEPVPARTSRTTA